MIKKFNDFNKINENITSNDLVFLTKIYKDNFSEFYLDESEFGKDLGDVDNYDISSVDMVIKWMLELDIKEWGVKSIDVSVIDIKGSFVVNIWGEDDDTEQMVDFDSEKLGFKIINNIPITDQIMPSDIEIDFKNKVITVH